MKNVFIHAYAAANLGDDLLVRCLCQRYPKVSFQICADLSYKERFRDISNLTVYSPEDKVVRFWDWIVRKIKHTDQGFWKYLLKSSAITVHIGGSVFVQHQEDFSHSFRLDQELSVRSRRICVVGANFGPYKNPEYYRGYRDLFGKYEGICFRDRFSYNLFQDLPNVSHASDVAFGYEFKNVKKEKRQLLISVIQLKNREGCFSISQYEECYLEFLVKVIHKYLKAGYEIKLISFCKIQGDEDTIEELINRAGVKDEKAVSVCYYDYNMEECLECFQESEVILGTRFHSVVLGWLVGKKVIPIVYDAKTRNLLEDNGCSFYIELSDLEKGTEELLKKMESVDSFDASVLRENAHMQFQVLDQILQ